MAKPRIIFINRVYWPSSAATAQLLTDLAEALAAREWTVHVISAGTEPGPHNGVKIHRTGKGDQHGGLTSRIRNYWRFIHNVRREIAFLIQPDDIVVIMTDPPLLGAAVARAAEKKGARVIHWIQDIYPEIVSAHLGLPIGWLLFTVRAKRDTTWRSAHRCVVLGKTMASTAEDRGVAVDRIAMIPNWAPRELEIAALPIDLAAQRKAWELVDKFIVAYSGNLGRVHEFDAIFSAAEILRDRPDIVFLFIATGARLAGVRSEVERKKLKNVRFVPSVPRDQLAVSLATVDVQLVTLKPAFAPLVYPSKLAGVLAAGRPVIFVGPPDGEIARLLGDAECGTCIAPNGGNILAETILQWQADHGHRARLGSKARETYEKNFTFKSALCEWEKILGAGSET